MQRRRKRRRRRSDREEVGKNCETDNA